MSETEAHLKQKYENIFREIVDFLPGHEASSLTGYMQALKYFFTFLCNEGIDPDQLSEEDVESYFLYRFSTGCSPATLKTYFGHLNRYYLCLQQPHLKFSRAQVQFWINKWEEDGVPTNLSERKPAIEISYTAGIDDLQNAINSFHPRR